MGGCCAASPLTALWDPVAEPGELPGMSGDALGPDSPAEGASRGEWAMLAML